MFFLGDGGRRGVAGRVVQGGVGLASSAASTVRTIAFPSYDGNGMFRSLGNILVHERVALLFVNFEQPDRLRVHGSASVAGDDPLLATWVGAQAVVRVEVVRAFPNCPQYIYRMVLDELSVFAPAPGHQPPEPAWKAMDEFRDYLSNAGPGGA